MSVFLEWAFHALVGKAGRLYWSRGVLMHSTTTGKPAESRFARKILWDVF
jgi:hypothetical protein